MCKSANVSANVSDTTVFITTIMSKLVKITFCSNTDRKKRLHFISSTPYTKEKKKSRITMKPKGKWKYADRIGLVLVILMNCKTILEIKHYNFLINREKKSILYDNYKFRNISGPVAL